MKVLMQHKCK